jgi:uncharacterized protein YidB (DUF937 family)
MAKGYPSMLALLGLLAVAGYQNRDKIAEMIKRGTDNLEARKKQDLEARSEQGGQKQQGDLSGVMDRLRDTLASSGVGGLLNSGLGELLDRFKQNGKHQVAQSWVSRGPNQDITSDELEAAIGPDVLDALSQQTKLPREEILARLSRQLPEAVDRYTPDGRLPEAA